MARQRTGGLYLPGDMAGAARASRRRRPADSRRLAWRSGCACLTTKTQANGRSAAQWLHRSSTTAPAHAARAGKSPRDANRLHSSLRHRHPATVGLALDHLHRGGVRSGTCARLAVWRTKTRTYRKMPRPDIKAPTPTRMKAQE